MIYVDIWYISCNYISELPYFAFSTAVFYLYERVFIKYHSVLGFEKSFLDTKVLTAIQKSFGFMLIANIQKGTKFLIFTLHKK